MPYSRRTFLKAGLAVGAAMLVPHNLGLRTARAQVPLLLDPFLQPKFVNPLPQPLHPDFIFRPTTPGGTHYEISVYQFSQDLGLIDPLTGTPLHTRVWGYGNPAQPATYPGRSFMVRKNQQITVQWSNNLTDGLGNPLPHLLPVDPSLHWADPLGHGHMGGAYTGPVPIAVHVHGGHSESQSDGLPDAWFTPDNAYTGRLFNPVYRYENDQEAATIWYHDHALGITRLNVYAGLAGYYIIKDTNEDRLVAQNKIPGAPYDIPIVIQDRMFSADGQLYYPSIPPILGAPNPSVLPEFFGDFILVNGQAWPVLEVEPRPYRFRLLNGSDSRFYNLFMNSGQMFFQIGTDDGFLNAPVPVQQLTIGPGERADVVVDFTAFANQTIIMRNNAKTPFPKGAATNPQTTGQIMAFRVNRPFLSTYPRSVLPVATAGNPAPLRDAPIVNLTGAARTRSLLLFEGVDEFGRLQPLLGTTAGKKLWSDPITENPGLNDVEIWDVYNTTMDAHPIHLHLVSFQIVSRQKFNATQDPVTGALTGIRLQGNPKPPFANERGWKDTAQMFPGEVTRIIARFDRPGEYVWHCHILSHEDHEMMRPYFVGPLPAAPQVNAPEIAPTFVPDN